MKKIWIIGCVAATLALTGCSQDSESAPSGTPSPSVTTVDPTTEPAVEEADAPEEDLQSWSIAAVETHSTVQDALSDWDNSGCTAMDFAMDDQDPLCYTKLIVLGMSSETAIIQWTGRLSSESLTYIPTKPSAISTHIDNVTEKIDRLKEQAGALDATCPDGDGCAGVILQTTLALEGVDTALSAWPR